MTYRIPFFLIPAFVYRMNGDKKNHRQPQISGGCLGLMVFLSLLFMASCPVAALENPAVGLSPAKGEGITWGPYITNTTGNCTTIHWVTDQPVPGRIEYGTLSGDGTVPAWITEHEDQAMHIHHILLEDLIPGQVYSYHIGGDTREYSFRTYPASGPLRFVVYGDTREQLPDWDQTRLHALVAGRISTEKDCLFVIHTGDLVNEQADASEWGRFFSAAGSMVGNMTFYPVPGNHEGNLTRFGELFGYPPWYSFECGDITFLVINSNSLRPEEAATQDRWLGQALAGTPGWTFAALHHPLFSSDLKHWGGFVDVAEKYRPWFEKNGIDAVFSAHVHAYEHYESGGVHYFTIATGGAPFYPLSPEKPPGFRAAMENTLAYARVTVDHDAALIEIIPVARVWDGVITSYPPGVVAERVIIHRQPARLPGVFQLPGLAGDLLSGTYRLSACMKPGSIPG